MQPKAFVSYHLVYALLKYAESLNIESASVSQAAKIQFVSHPEPGAQIPAAQYYRLWQEITQRAEIPDFGLSFARETHQQPIGGVLFTVMLNCPSVGVAMEKLARYHGLATDMIQIRIRHQSEITSYAWESTFESLPLDRHISEAVISWLFFTMRGLSGGVLPIEEVRFHHQAPKDIRGHQETFGCPVIFGSECNEILVTNQALKLSIPLADPRLLNRLEVILREQLQEIYSRDTWSERVISWIGETLLRGDQASLNDVAKRACLSTRQLQNKLQDEGTSYRQLLERARKEMAIRYLSEPDMSFFDIAFLLGFSDQSAFNHAFKRWTGLTPGEYRNRT